jgi:hypothetical protein
VDDDDNDVQGDGEEVEEYEGEESDDGLQF